MTTTGHETTTISYDQAGRLTGYDSGIGSAVGYTYDGDGLRASKTVEPGGTPARFTWDLSPSVPLLLSDQAASYLYGPDGQPIEQIAGSTPTYLHADAQGSIRMLTDAQARVVGSYTYGPYGRTYHHTGLGTPLQYDGQYTDAETGYQYLRARFYDPNTGAFLTRDPAVSATRIPYGFAGNDPFDHADPTGLSWWNPFSWTAKTWAVVGVVAGVAGLAGLTLLTGGADLPFLAATAGTLEGGAGATVVAGEALGTAAVVAEEAQASGLVALRALALGVAGEPGAARASAGPAAGGGRAGKLLALAGRAFQVWDIYQAAQAVRTIRSDCGGTGTAGNCAGDVVTIAAGVNSGAGLYSAVKGLVGQLRTRPPGA